MLEQEKALQHEFITLLLRGLQLKSTHQFSFSFILTPHLSHNLIIAQYTCTYIIIKLKHEKWKE